MRIFLCLLLSLLACVSGQKKASVSDVNYADTLRQGIQGKVLWLEGNLMPTIVEDSQKIEADQGTPVERTVCIYQLTHQNQATLTEGFYTDINSKLIKKVATGEDGQFQVYLEPGRYSVFVEEPQGLYANLFDGQGYIQPVTVIKDSVSQITLKVDYKAVY